VALCLAAGGAARAEQVQIKITGASYGYAAERKDVKDDVIKYCDGKPSCTFMVKNDNFPSKMPVDPSPGNDKGLMVFWKCGDQTHKTQFAEGRNAVVDCQ
jgi:hypothetical protein